MKLYNVAYSGNSYKVRLLLAQLGVVFEVVEVDILKGESRTVPIRLLAAAPPIGLSGS
jgi:glutathione S-transferase